MRPRSNSPAVVFEKVLGAFGTGGFNYEEFLTQSKQLLADAASPRELLEVLHRFELVEPLPDYAHEEIVGLLNEAIERVGAQNVDSDTVAGEIPASDSAPNTDEEVIIDFDQLNDLGEDSIPERDKSAYFSQGTSRSAATSTASVLTEFVRPSAVEVAPLAGRVHALAEQLAQQNADNEALTRSYERAKNGESAAIARTTALTAELGSARTTLELEQRKTRDAENALADRIASADAARSRSEEVLRESERHQTESRALRDSLAAQNAAIVKLRQALGEREVQLAALQQEHARIVPALDARASALDVDLAALRSALESERIKARELTAALTQKTALAEAAKSGSDDALREVERGRAESRTDRDLLAARDAALVQARHSLAQRDAQLAALQQEHAKMMSGLEAGAKTGTQLEAQLLTAQARADAISLDLKTAQAAGAELSARLKRSEDHVNAAVAELAALKAKESSQLESLRTREWRDGFGHNMLRELNARADAASVGQRRLVTERDQLQAQVADLQKERVDTREKATNLPKKDPAARGAVWNRRAVARAMGVGAVVIVLAAIAWFSVHRTPAPPPLPVASSPVLPSPGTVIRDCATCPGMTVLPAGRFRQGSDAPESGSESFAKPAHWVAIGGSLAMAANAVTVDEFQEFIAATGVDVQGCDTYDGQWKHRAKNNWKNPGFAQTGLHPVTCVSWNDAKAYANWLSMKTGHAYRLPSASEWEYAARAGGAVVQPWNPDGSDACANANVADASAVHRYPGWAAFACDDGFVYTAPVGTFKTNSFGLNDMLGNVFQWTLDCWSADYAGAPTDGSARTDGNCTEHELRGGSWFSTPAYVKADYRNHFAADYRTSSVGIRLVRDIER
jgi:sulfatase modifying factor 1